jgi:hypothetical protein
MAHDPRLDQMRFDVRVARLPRLEIEVDLEARLLLAQGVRDLDEDSPVAVRVGLAFDSPQELEELLTCIWVHLNPQSDPVLTLGDAGRFVEFW